MASDGNTPYSSASARVGGSGVPSRSVSAASARYVARNTGAVPSGWIANRRGVHTSSSSTIVRPCARASSGHTSVPSGRIAAPGHMTWVLVSVIANRTSALACAVGGRALVEVVIRGAVEPRHATPSTTTNDHRITDHCGRVVEEPHERTAPR